MCRSLRRELEVAGCTFRFNTEVKQVREGAVGCTMDLGEEQVTAHQVITCAGLWADRLARCTGAPANPRILPFRGVFLRLKPTEQPVVRGIVYPVPDPGLPFLGAHVTKQVSGEVSFGPTAMLAPSRDGYLLRTVRARDAWETATWPGTWKVARRYWRTGMTEIGMAASKRAYVRAAAAYIPSLTVASVADSFESGVRAQAVSRNGTLVDDFVISQQGSISHVRNAPSPAATSAFALAEELLAGSV